MHADIYVEGMLLTPEDYPGLPDLTNHALVLKFLNLQEHGLNFSVSFFEENAKFLLRSMRLIAADDALLTTTEQAPEIYACDIAIDSRFIEKMIKSYPKNPAYPNKQDLSLATGAIQRRLIIPIFELDHSWMYDLTSKESNIDYWLDHNFRDILTPQS